MKLRKNPGLPAPFRIFSSFILCIMYLLRLSSARSAGVCPFAFIAIRDAPALTKGPTAVVFAEDIAQCKAVKQNKHESFYK